MSDDVNYVSDYFYTKKQGQIGSLLGPWSQTSWQVDGGDLKVEQTDGRVKLRLPEDER